MGGGPFRLKSQALSPVPAAANRIVNHCALGNPRTGFSIGERRAVKILFLVLLVAAIALSAYFGARRPAAEPDTA